MSPKPAKHKPPTKKPKPKLGVQSRTKTVLKRIWNIVGLAIVGIALIASVLSLMPRFSVSSSLPIDPSNPLSVPIIVSNDGLLDVNDVEVIPSEGEFTMDNVTLSAKEWAKSDFAKVGKFSGRGISYLEPSQRFTITLDEIFTIQKGSSMKKGDLGIVVSCRPWGVPWRVERRYRLTTREGAGGNIYWIQNP